MNGSITVGSIESAITEEQEKAYDTYLLIDVKPKNINDRTPEELVHIFKRRAFYSGLEAFINQLPSFSEMTLTDDAIPIEEYIIRILFSVLLGKNISLHLRISYNAVNTVNRWLEETVERESQVWCAFLRWRYSNNDYIIELMRRFPDWSEYILRLGSDGKGVIIYLKEDAVITFYYELHYSQIHQLLDSISKRIDFIVVHPVCVHEDDRYFGCPVHLKYNIQWTYPDAASSLKQYDIYEDTDYGFDESEIPIARQLLEIPIIKEKWLRLHEEDE